MVYMMRLEYVRDIWLEHHEIEDYCLAIHVICGTTEFVSTKCFVK